MTTRSSLGILGATCLLALAAVAAKQPAANVLAKTGRMRLTFDERSPLSAPEEVVHRTKIQIGDPSGRRAISEQEKASLSYDVGDYEFDVVVPARYKRGDPHGLFIWVGQCDLQNVWLPILARHKLIAAVPEDPRIPRDKKVAQVSRTGRDLRVGLALDAVHNLSNRYDVDERRVYVAGFSAGGGLAADLLRGYPEVFSGVCCFMGGEFYACPPDKSGKSEPSSAEDGFAAWQCPIEQAKRDAKIVLMRGEKDGARGTAAWGRADAESLRLEGFTRVTYIELPKWPHFPPTAPWFNKAITALERKPTTPPTTRPTTAGEKAHPDQLAQARRLVAGAKMELKMREQFLPGGVNEHAVKLKVRWTERARKPLMQVLADYPDTPAAREAREMLDRLDNEEPAPKP